MKYLFSIAITLIMASNISFALINQQKYDCWYCEKDGEGTYNIVAMICDDIECGITCIGGGNEACNLGNALDNCIGCIEYEGGLYSRGRGDEMVDHAHDEIDNGNHTGNWNDNFIDVLAGLTYFRSVTWTYNTITEVRDIEVLITETDEY